MKNIIITTFLICVSFSPLVSQSTPSDTTSVIINDIDDQIILRNQATTNISRQFEILDSIAEFGNLSQVDYATTMLFVFENNIVEGYDFVLDRAELYYVYGGVSAPFNDPYAPIMNRTLQKIRHQNKVSFYNYILNSDYLNQEFSTGQKKVLSRLCHDAKVFLYNQDEDRHTKIQKLESMIE